MVPTANGRPRSRSAIVAALLGLAIVAALAVWALFGGPNEPAAPADRDRRATDVADSVLRSEDTPGRMTGIVVMESTPSGATIHLSDSSTGHATPHTFSLAADRPHDFSFRLPGYLSGSYPDVRVGTGDTLRIHHRLVARLSSLTVSSRPGRALVVVDGREVGHTPVAVESLATGPHEIRIHKDGYRAWTGTVHIPARRDRLGVVLKPLPPQGE